MVIAFSVTLKGDDRGREMAEVGLQRTLAAIEDLDADEFLPPPAPTFSRAGAPAALSRGRLQDKGKFAVAVIGFCGDAGCRFRRKY